MQVRVFKVAVQEGRTGPEPPGLELVGRECDTLKVVVVPRTSAYPHLRLHRHETRVMGSERVPVTARNPLFLVGGQAGKLAGYCLCLSAW